jgi:tetratricopeptide (TPR) repeat protein
MRVGTAILGLVVSLTFAAQAVDAQTRSRKGSSGQNAHTRNRVFNQRIEYSTGNQLGRSPLGTYEGQRYQGFRTRGERWRATNLYSSLMRNARSPLSAVSPMELLLDQRNLLSARSNLGRMMLQSAKPPLFLATSVSGSSLPGPPPPLSKSAYEKPSTVTGGPAPSAPVAGAQSGTAVAAAPVNSTVVTAAPSSVVDSLKERLRSRSEEYYATGLARFRERDYLKAKNSFDMARDLDPESPRLLIACMLTSHVRADYVQSQLYMGRLLARAKGIGDFEIDLAQYDIDKQQLQRLIDHSNLATKQYPNSLGPHTTLAFFSWLRGDYATAVSAAEAAGNNAANGTPELVADLQRFVDILKTAQAQSPGGKR